LTLSLCVKQGDDDKKDHGISSEYYQYCDSVFDLTRLVIELDLEANALPTRPSRKAYFNFDIIHKYIYRYIYIWIYTRMGK